MAGGRFSWKAGCERGVVGADIFLSGRYLRRMFLRKTRRDGIALQGWDWGDVKVSPHGPATPSDARKRDASCSEPSRVGTCTAGLDVSMPRCLDASMDVQVVA
jgi:hypothetical protein